MIALAAVGPSVYWYLTRGSGAVALVLLTVSVVIGIAGTLRVSASAWPRFAIETVHRDVSLLVIVFLAVHIVTGVLDSFAPISLTASVVPFISSYRPLWLGLGALSFDLLLALTITSLLRRSLGYASWRAVHWLAYASWPVAVLHGLGTGSDTKVWWMLTLTAGCVIAVALAMALRFGRGEGTPVFVRVPAMALSGAVAVGMAVFTLAGPLAPGWAKKAGTPPRLLVSAPPVPAVVHAAVPAGAQTPFAAALSGQIVQRTVASGGLIDLDLRLAGTTPGRLRVRLAGAPIPGGGLSLTGSQVDLLLSNRTGTLLTGTITSLQGSNFVARVTGASGALSLSVQLTIDQAGGTVSGSLRATP